MSFNIFIEIIVRVVFLFVAGIMHALYPHMRYITEKDFDDYKKLKKESIIPPWMILLLVIFVPLLLFYLHASLETYTKSAHLLLAWTLSITITAFLTITGKLIVGRPRPDFFYRCFPDGVMTYDLACTGSKHDVIEGRKSFPSGHSSFSFCSLGFISFWMCGELGVLSRNRGQALRVICCLLPLTVASVVSMTRYCDNHHHWEDVAVGSLIGVWSSYFCYRQYFHPLDSDLSGTPLEMLSEDSIYETSSDEECCTNHLNPSSSHYRCQLTRKSS